MKQQNLKALTNIAIHRADASPEAPAAQLTPEQAEQVHGGLDAASKDACKMTVLAKRYPEVVDGTSNTLVF